MEEPKREPQHLKIKKRIEPGRSAQAIRVSRFVFIFPSQPRGAALKERFVNYYRHSGGTSARRSDV